VKPFGSKAYDTLKTVALIWLPASATLYNALAGLWGWGHVAQVVGTITATDTFLGVILGISTAYYSASAKIDGVLNVDTSDPIKDTYSLEIHTPLEDMAWKKSITLQVKTPDAA